MWLDYSHTHTRFMLTPSYNRFPSQVCIHAVLNESSNSSLVCEVEQCLPQEEEKQIKQEKGKVSLHSWDFSQTFCGDSVSDLHSDWKRAAMWHCCCCCETCQLAVARLCLRNMRHVGQSVASNFHLPPPLPLCHSKLRTHLATLPGNIYHLPLSVCLSLMNGIQEQLGSQTHHEVTPPTTTGWQQDICATVVVSCCHPVPPHRSHSLDFSSEALMTHEVRE